MKLYLSSETESQLPFACGSHADIRREVQSNTEILRACSVSCHLLSRYSHTLSCPQAASAPASAQIQSMAWYLFE